MSSVEELKQIEISSFDGNGDDIVIFKHCLAAFQKFKGTKI